MDASARRCCAAEALCAVAGMRTGPPGVGFLEEAARRLFDTSVGSANDDPRFSHADAACGYDAAIALIEARGRGARVA